MASLPLVIPLLRMPRLETRSLRRREKNASDLNFSPKYRMPDPREISVYCSSLMVIVSVTGNSHNEDDKRIELQLAHFSVKEYLTSNRLDSDVAQKFWETSARASIAKVCLTYLLHFEQDISPEEIRKTFPLAQYSAR
jgi:hypothetical protein